MNTNARRFTDDVISAVEDGFLSWEEVARACLGYMSEDEVEAMVRSEDWAIADDDVEDEEDEKSYVDSLPEETLDKIWKIAERYNTSSPVSGNWETEAIHERDAIVKELGLTKKEANEVMVEYLGFDNLDLELAEKEFGKKVTAQDVIDAAKEYGLTFTEQELKDLEWDIVDYINDSEVFNDADEWMKAVVDGETEDLSDVFVKDANWKKVFNESLTEESEKEVCPDCGKEVGKDGHCYNQECVAYDPVSQYLEEQAEEDVLVKNGYYDELDFHEAGLLIGDVELQYEKLPVIDQFDEDVEIDHTFTVFISPDMVIDFLCAQRGLDRKKLTITQTQKHIDDLAKNPEDFYQYLKEHFAEEATEEAQYKIAESYKEKENFEFDDDDDDVLGWSE